MYERFTDRARKAMQIANQIAAYFGREHIGTEHILVGLIRTGAVPAAVLANHKVEEPAVLSAIRDSYPRDVIVETTRGRLPQTPRAKLAIEAAMEWAMKLGYDYVGTEHLLLGILDYSKVATNTASVVLASLSVPLGQLREEVVDIVKVATATKDVPAKEAKHVYTVHRHTFSGTLEVQDVTNLRDIFASQALAGDWSAQGDDVGIFGSSTSDSTLRSRAVLYYRMADMMLAVRAETAQPQPTATVDQQISNLLGRS